MRILTLISITINILFLSTTFYFFKIKKKKDLFRKEVEDVQAFKEFFISNRIDF